ncbi:Sts1p Ecym_4397 [Eremothecium cymbalariae DBVPG|uniref:Tethering factor for nuclear proteasome STS1 n=1 Tax=Eremothecium cymbalariae (strain CBS 270.75 / DBVPG 7215 / KCTC 17166 / NRRL Y-17582) TaxID=931890 RepID=G8JTU8_ERECY|nr:hypothetical protein Ecym_4397 [Eremothecium cymbalariae DBVPG\
MNHSVGFDWGFKTKDGEHNGGSCSGGLGASAITTPNNQHTGSHFVHTNYRVGKAKLKRRLTAEDGFGNGVGGGNNAHVGGVSGGSCQGYRRVSKRKAVHYNLIQGQPLPIPRAIEMMDKETLESMLLRLINLHPEIQDSLASIHPLSHDMDKYTALLEKKMGAVYDHIPYSKYGHTLNDYAFVRMKPSLLEFLNCLIDCLLDSIPPRSTNLLQSFKFAKYVTGLLAQLPQFATESNNYYKNICYEQVSEIWNTLIKHASSGINFLSTKPSLLHYLHELKQFNEQSKGKFEAPLQLFFSIMDDGCTPTTTAAAAAAAAADSGSAADELGNGKKNIEQFGIWNNVA